MHRTWQTRCGRMRRWGESHLRCCAACPVPPALRPGAGMMRELEGRAEALAGTFNAQDVANTLCGSVRVFFCSDTEIRCLNALAQRRASLSNAVCFNTAQLCQVHQFFVGCDVEPRLRMEAINDTWALKETCREAFECDKSAPSASTRDVASSSWTPTNSKHHSKYARRCATWDMGLSLRHMGLSVENE